MDNVEFETKFQKVGFASQRRYPNEGFISFLSANYLGFDKADRAKTRILELGCGSGANLWMPAREGFDVYGIDTAHTGIKLCAEMLKSWGVSATIAVGDMRKLEFADQCFDVVFDVVSMQHVDLKDHLLCYKEAHRCLKPGGRFFQYHLSASSTSFIESGGNLIDKLTVDNIANPQVPLNNCGLTNFLTPDVAEELLKAAGFQQIETETIRRSYKHMTQYVEYLIITARKPERP